MGDSELYEAHDKASAESRITAYEKVAAMNLPTDIHLADTVAEFGSLTAKYVRHLQIGLSSAYGDGLPRLLALALREFWHACWQASSYMAVLTGSGRGGGMTSEMQALCTPEGYADSEGWAYTLDNFIASEVDHKNFLLAHAISQQLTPVDVLQCIALYWFHKAAEEYRNEETDRAFNLFHEAHEALNLANGLAMYQAGLESDELGSNRERTAFAKSGAISRHAGTRKTKAEALRLYSEGTWVSKRQAAHLLAPKIRLFCVANSLRKLSPDREKQTIYEWILAFRDS